MAVNVRVLVVGLNYAPEATGIAPYSAAFSRGLARRGYQVRVVTTMTHYPEWQVHDGFEGWRRKDRVDGVNMTRLRHYVPTAPSGVRRLGSEFSFGCHAALAAWGRPDIVVFVSPALFATGIVSLRAHLRDVPAVVWVQDVHSLGLVETQGAGDGGFVARAVTAVESVVLTRASGVSVIHNRFDRVVEGLGAEPQRTMVVRNWTHLPKQQASPRHEARKRLGDGDEVVVLHSGAMGRKQDLDNVVGAARIAHERGVPLRFVLTCNGSERSRLEQAAGDLPSITFLHPLPGTEFQDALAAADAPLVNEHAGLHEMAVSSKLTSYFSSGRPVVAATDPESVTAEEIAASQGGVRVDAGQPEQLVDAVLEVGRDPGRAARLGDAGRRYQEAVLSGEPTMDRYTAWLEGIVQEHRCVSRWQRVRRIVRPARTRQPDNDAVR